MDSGKPSSHSNFKSVFGLDEESAITGEDGGKGSDYSNSLEHPGAAVNKVDPKLHRSPGLDPESIAVVPIPREAHFSYPSGNYQPTGWSLVWNSKRRLGGFSCMRRREKKKLGRAAILLLLALIIFMTTRTLVKSLLTGEERHS